MTYNLQYKFRPEDMAPGFREGQEMCVDASLTEYAKSLNLSCHVLQLWGGQGEESEVLSRAIIDTQTGKILFMDPRYDVICYMLEQLRSRLDDQLNQMENQDDAQE